MNHSLFSFYFFSPFSLSLFSPFALVSPFALEGVCVAVVVGGCVCVCVCAGEDDARDDDARDDGKVEVKNVYQKFMQNSRSSHDLE